MTLFTEHSLSEGEKEFIEKNGIEWMRKPFTASDVATLVQRMLNGQ